MATPLERLKELMQEQDLRQQDIINATGISSSCLSSYLNGTRNPKADKMCLIADAFGVSRGWIMGLDDSAEKSFDKGVVLAELSRSKNLDLFLEIDNLPKEKIELIRTMIRSWKE